MYAKTILAAVVVSLIAGSASGLGSAGADATYVGGASTIFGPSGACGPTGDTVGFGSVCFDAPEKASHVNIHIDDRVTDTPGGFIFFKSDSGTVLSPQMHFCTSHISRELPSGTAEVVIQFWDPLHHENPMCSATTGTVGALFR